MVLAKDATKDEVRILMRDLPRIDAANVPQRDQIINLIVTSILQKPTYRSLLALVIDYKRKELHLRPR